MEEEGAIDFGVTVTFILVALLSIPSVNSLLL
jgi:hypothetical protein